MSKVLVALRSPDDVEAILLGAKIMRERGASMAVCQVRARGDDGRSDLALQRQITSRLRATLGTLAEEVPVFVIGESLGDDLASIAKTWDADVLVSNGNVEPIT